VEYHGADGALCWSVQARDIVLLAEYTTDEGPFVDDYFLVFVTQPGGGEQYVTASFYAEGSDEVVGRLAECWGAEVGLSLAHSTDWNSRVIWPPELAEQEYFEVIEVPPGTLLARLREAVFGPVYTHLPSKAVREYLARRGQR